MQGQVFQLKADDTLIEISQWKYDELKSAVHSINFAAETENVIFWMFEDNFLIKLLTFFFVIKVSSIRAFDSKQKLCVQIENY